MRALIVAVALIPSLASGFQNEPTGFRGIEFGVPAEKFRAELVGREGPTPGVAIYQRKGDKMAIGEAQLSSITYAFYKGRFQQVVLRTAEGAGNPRALREAFVSQFGRGDQPDRHTERWIWSGPVAYIFLDCSARTHCTASITSRAISDEQRRDKKAAAKAAKKSF